MSTDGEHGVLLEERRRFSESVLWTIQKAYYDARGPAAWHSGQVPHYATCNTYIAQAYADVVAAYLRELVRTRRLDPGAPIYVVELAAGVGAFACYFLHKFAELRAASSLRDLDVRYVMTDFTDANLRGWRAHPHLRGFVEAGALEFGVFDVDVHDRVALAGGATLAPGGLANPIVVLANYAFDTFRQDLFCVEQGQLHEVQVSTRTTGPVAPSRDDLLAALRTQYTNRPIEARGYYEDPVHDRLLADYRAQLPESTFLVPIGALRAVERLLALAGGAGLLLSSDKGFTHLDELYHPSAATMEPHGGCFSMMVNYHAIGQSFAHRGGFYASTARRHLNLKTALCVRGGTRDELADTLATFRRQIEDFGPGEFFDLFQQDREREKTIPQILGLLRLSGYDPGVLYAHAAQVRAQCQGLAEPLKVELRLALDRVWRHYYAGPQNLPFELGRIFLALGRPHEGARFNQIAIEYFGEAPAAYLNMGICHYQAEDPAQALRCFERAREMNPDFSPPHEWIARIEAERARAQPPAAASRSAAAPPAPARGADRP